MTTETISSYCRECVRHTSGNCEGKKGGPVRQVHWGQIKTTRVSGFSFCNGYEFDERFYCFRDGSEQAAAISRKVVIDHDEVQKEEEKEEKAVQQNSDAADLGETLSLDDFADII